MTNWNCYFVPESIDKALDLLTNAQGTSCIIAGGTDLLLEIAQGRHQKVDNLVDINKIPELQIIKIHEECLIIGSAVSLRRLAESNEVRQHAPALMDACGLIAGPQVRNVATLGGNVCHALPAADGMIALMAIQPTLRIANSKSEREVKLQELFKGPGESTLARDEIAIQFKLPLRKAGQASAFSRIMRPQGVALPILNLAVWLERKGDLVSNCRIAVGPSGPVPSLSTLAAEKIIGKIPSSEVLEECAVAILAQAKYRSSPRRATADYRKHITKILLQDVFDKAWQRSLEVQE